MAAESVAYRTLVVLQPTPFCNIDCGYCYLPQRSNRQRMSPAVLERVAEEVFGSALVEPPIVFLWHLGEPLSLPNTLYRDYFAIIDRAHHGAPREYIHSFQTNGTLIDRDWVEFLAHHRVRLGVSIDGPAFLHDHQRVTRSGNGTHAAALRGIHLLQGASVPFSVIAVLTDFTLDHPDAFFQFFLDQRLDDVGFNIDEIEGVHGRTSFTGVRALPRYQAFLRRLLQLSEQYEGAVKFREFWTNLRTLATGTTEPYNTTNRPFRILNFDAAGNFNTFCPELRVAKSERFGDFVMGNILRDSLGDLTASPVFRLVSEEIERGISACRQQCEHWRFCGGGAPSNKFFEHGRFDVTETTTCRIHKKATVDVLVEYLEQKLASGATPSAWSAWSSHG